MRRRSRLNPFGLTEPILHGLRYRFNAGGVAPGGAGAAPGDGDIEPVNGGPDRDFDSLSSGTVDEPVSHPSYNDTNASAALTPADPNQRVGATSGQQTQAAQWQSIREAAEAQGFRFDPTVTDDRSALNFLLARAAAPRQASIYEQLGRQLAPKSQEIQQFLSQQSQPQQPTRQPWEAPEFDERWANLVEQEPTTGLFVAKQGVPHEIAQKVNAYVEWKRGFDRNPAAVINGMVEARAKAVATETFREQFAAQQREAAIGSIAQENSAWLYQVDAGGQRLRDYSGNFVPTPVGAAYLQQLQAVRQMGVVDPRQQDQLAKQLVRGQVALAAQQQAGGVQQQAANPQTQQAIAQPNRNPLQAQPPSQRRATPSATDPNEVGLSLAERIRRDLAAEGVTDSDVFNSFGQ